MLLAALGGGNVVPPHPHTRHVPRARLAVGTPVASFTSFFGFGFLFFLRNTLDRIRLPQCGASVSSSGPSAWLSSESVGLPFLFPINPILHIDSGFSFGIPISLHIAKDEFASLNFHVGITFSPYMLSSAFCNSSKLACGSVA